MAKFCTQCGKELDENGVCPACSKTDAVPAAPATITVPAKEKEKDRVTAWGFFGLMVLFSLPFIGLIAVIVLSLAPSNKNLKSFARGYLLYTVIIALVATLLVVALSVMVKNGVTAIPELTSEATNGEYSSLGEALQAIEEHYGFSFGDLFGKVTNPNS